jgi:hypothetical protein
LANVTSNGAQSQILVEDVHALTELPVVGTIVPSTSR